MSSCSDDCICCCLPCIICWACVYYTYAGVRAAGKFCYKKCRRKTSNDDDEGTTIRQSSVGSTGNSKSSFSNRQGRDMEKIASSEAASLQIPAPVHSANHNVVRSHQPLPTEQMTFRQPLVYPQPNDGSPGSSRRGSAHGSQSDRYRPQWDSAVSSNLFAAADNGVVREKQDTNPTPQVRYDGSELRFHAPLEVNLRSTPPPSNANSSGLADSADNGITIEARSPREVAIHTALLNRPPLS